MLLSLRRARGHRGWCAVACVTLSVSLMGCRPSAVPEQLPIAVQVTTLAPESITTEMRYSATVKELQKVDLSFKVAGTVRELFQVTEPGSSQMRDVQVGRLRAVRGGAREAGRRRLPAQVECGDGEAGEGREPARAAIADADLAAKDLARCEALSAKGAETQENLDAAQRRRITADAAVVSAERERGGGTHRTAAAEGRSGQLRAGGAQMGLAYVAEKYVERNERVRRRKPHFW